MSMKTTGLLIVLLAFLVGAFLSVLDPEAVAWNWMVPVLAAGSVGLWIHRKAQHAEDRSDHKLAGNMDTLQTTLEAILNNLNDLDARKMDIPVYEARFEIDHLFREDLNRFAEARESMIHVFGMQQFADVMSSFAAGERYINRVWSASTDGYEDEVRKFIGRAREQFTEAVALFRGLRSEADMEPTVSGSRVV
jgi:hypothetical protein